MRAHIILKGSKELLADVDLEVVPRGRFIIDDVAYQYNDQPTFIIQKNLSKMNTFAANYVLRRVELLVEKEHGF